MKRLCSTVIGGKNLRICLIAQLFLSIKYCFRKCCHIFELFITLYGTINSIEILSSPLSKLNAYENM